MCFIPDIPVLSPLPNAEIPHEQPIIESDEEAEIPPEQPIIESDEEDSPIVRNPMRIDEYGREYYPHPRYADSDEVPESMRLYPDNGDDDEEMSSHGVDYENEEEEMEELVPSEDEEQELVPSEDEEQELPAQVESPPPPHPQPVVPPQPSEPLLCRSVEDRLWRRLREAEREMKRRDEEIIFLHSKAEYASRQAQQCNMLRKGSQRTTKKPLTDPGGILNTCR